MKKRIMPVGYEEVTTGPICVGDMVWNKMAEEYQETTQECPLNVLACVSVVRPKVSELMKITKLLEELCTLVPQIKLSKGGALIVVGHCGQQIATLEFHRGGKLKGAKT